MIGWDLSSSAPTLYILLFWWIKKVNCWKTRCYSRKGGFLIWSHRLQSLKPVYLNQLWFEGSWFGACWFWASDPQNQTLGSSTVGDPFPLYSVSTSWVSVIHCLVFCPPFAIMKNFLMRNDISLKDWFTLLLMLSSSTNSFVITCLPWRSKLRRLPVSAFWAFWAFCSHDQNCSPCIHILLKNNSYHPATVQY